MTGVQTCALPISFRNITLAEPDRAVAQILNLLTAKSILYVANVDEQEIQNELRAPQVQALVDFAAAEGNRCIRLCGKVEQEIALLDQAEQAEFIAEYNLKEVGLSKLIHAAYDLLGYQTFFTGGPKEVRAWMVRKGDSAYHAAGCIHTDFQRGFIKAEVFHYDELIRLGSEKAVKEAGLVGLEGRNYIVKDGDLIFFKFNV